jgi:hypothetical protein
MTMNDKKMRNRKSGRGFASLVALLVSLVFVSALFAESGRIYRRDNVHRANQVKTVFGNWGVVGQPSNKGPRGAWIYDNNGYVGDVSPMIGVKVNTTKPDGDPVTFHSVVVAPVDRPNLGGPEADPTTGKLWGFEPVAGYFNTAIPESQQKIAISSNPKSWPQSWPDRDATWDGAWNGYFGKEPNADEESYYVMDDNNDEEFNFANNNAWGVEFKPDANNDLRNGLGLEVKVRGMQWAQFLAQDVIFWLYEVTNHSTTDYAQVTFGSLVGTYVGVTSTEDFGEYDDDWSFFDVENDLTYTGDFDNNVRRNPTWVGSDVGMVGYAFLESPGNPYNGIDDDRDAEDYGSGDYFTENDFKMRILQNGSKIVLIDDNYERSVATITNTPQTFTTRGGWTMTLAAGDTLLPEGNEILRPGATSQTDMMVNPNAFDGIDNDFDGLVDENYYLHYRQVRKDQEGNILFDIVNPTMYINYVTGNGLLNPMIDERRDDGIDNDGDWDPMYDDVGSDGIPNTNDPDGTEGNGIPDPGEPNFDATDPDESDQIGLSAFNYFAPAGDFPMKNDEALWEMMAPGYFDVPSSIQDGRPVGGEDGDFVFSSGYFPLRAGQTERFSIALLYGHDLPHMYRNLKTVKDIYDSDYRFPTPPLKPNVWAVAGDGYVRLYWDRRAEASIDPVLKEKDFEGYKIYRSTDPNFNDVYTVTNSLGTVVAHKPIVQFDLKNGITGPFYASPELVEQTDGYVPYLGDDTGLQHSWVDSSVSNGRTYYYAVVAYDRGDSERNILPSENTKRISIDEVTYEVITDVNTVVVVPGPTPPGYTSSEGLEELEEIRRVSSGSIKARIVDPTALKDHSYIVSFKDEATDGVDNDGDWTLANDLNGNGVPDPGEPNFEYKDPQELRRLTTSYSVLDSNFYTITIKHNDTIPTPIGFVNIRPETFELKTLNGTVINPANYSLLPAGGFIKANMPGVFTTDSLMCRFQYYPVFESPNIAGSNFAPETKDSDIFDGIQLVFNNQWKVELVDSLTGWNFEGGYTVSFGTTAINVGGGRVLTPVLYPSDYALVFDDNAQFSVNNSDFLQATALNNMGLPENVATNFKMANMSEGYDNELIWSDNNGNNVLDPADNLFVFDKIQLEDGSNEVEYFFTWMLIFKKSNLYPDSTFALGIGDSLIIKTTKPFRQGDILHYRPSVPSIDETQIADQLSEIRVFPNPYVAAHSFEPPLPPGVTSGRGERRVYFSNLPYDSKVLLFTSRGEHVRTIENKSSLHNSTITWDLKTKENLDIAYGVYFYVIETPQGIKRGKLAVIK